MKKRVKELDYVRGIAALSIMIFHYLSLIDGQPSANSVIGKLGVYGVSIFYILSGLTLHLVYKNKLLNGRDIKSFFLKRIFRIYPLMILVTTVILIFSRTDHSLLKIILNYTGLFGFVAPAEYIVSGLWSIGNELVFYTFFPLMIFLLNKGKSYFMVFFVLTCLVAIYFTYFIIDPTHYLSQEWSLYVNPFNQLYLFTGGVFIGTMSLNVNTFVKKLILLSTVLLFILYPINHEEIALVIGNNRVVFSLLMFTLIWAIFNTEIRLPSIMDKTLSFLGDISYSLYLWHSIVYLVLLKFNFITSNKVVFFVSASLFSFLISYLSYQYFEKKLVKLGGKLKL